MDCLLAQESAVFSQMLDDQPVAVKDEFALEQFTGFVGVTAFFIDRAEDVQMVLKSGQIVDIAVARSRMDRSGTCFQIDVVAQDDEGFPVVVFRERMLAFSVFEIASFSHTQDRSKGNAAVCGDLVHQVFGHDQDFSLIFHPGIFKVRVQADSDVCRDGPGRRRPHQHEGFLSFGSLRRQAVILDKRHLDVNGRRLLIGVLDFCLGQSRFAVRAPVYGLLALVDIAFMRHFAKDTDLFRFEGRAHRDVRVVPGTQHAEAFEPFPLDIDPLERVFLAHLAQFQRRQFVAVHAGRLQAGMLDRHTVRIPARYIGGIVAPGEFIFQDDILQDLVQSMAQMDLPVGIRRSVMQDEFLMARMGFQSFFIDIILLPEFQESRFPRR